MTLTLEMMLGLAGSAVTLAAFWWGIARWVLAEFSKRDLAIAAESARAKLAEDGISRDIAAHKLYAAENFATTHELALALARVEAAIEKLSDRLDKVLMTDRSAARSVGPVDQR